MTQVNIHEDTNSIAFSDLNIGDVFESCGKVYIKYDNDEGEDTFGFGLQIYPPDNFQFHCDAFPNDEVVIERDCTIEIK